MEPTSSGFAVGKILSGVAGFFGGLSLSFFWQPKKLHQHGKLAAGAIVGGIAVGASVTLGGVVAMIFGLDFSNSDVALGIGYAVGALSVGVVSFVANFFDRREDKDILEVAKELRSGTKTPVKDKKVVRKVAKKGTKS